MVDDEQLAEVNREQGRAVLELYPRRDGTPWSLDYEDALGALIEARELLG